MNRKVSVNVPHPQCIRLYQSFGDSSKELEGYIFVGAKHSSSVQETLKEEFQNKSLSQSSVKLLENYFTPTDVQFSDDIFNHPRDSSKSIPFIPIFLDIYSRTSIRHFRLICQHYIQTSKTETDTPLYFWYENPKDIALFQAKRLVEFALNGDGIINPAILEQKILFPYDWKLPEHVFSHDQFFEIESVDNFVQEIARRQCTQVCLETGRTISLFDHAAIAHIYKLTQQHSEPDENVPKTIRSSILFFTDKRTLVNQLPVRTDEVALESFLKTIEESRHVNGTHIDVEQLHNVFESVPSNVHVENIFMKSCQLHSPFMLRSWDVEHIFRTFCLSTNIVASCYSDPQQQIQNFKYFGPDIKRRSKFGNGSNKEKMLEWISSMSKYHTYKNNQISFQVLVGQVATNEFIPCTIKKFTKSSIDVEFVQQNHEGESRKVQETFSMDTAEFLFVKPVQSKETFTQWIQTRKNVQMYKYSTIFIQPNTENIDDQGVYIEYLSGNKEGCFEHVHQSFIHTDKKMQSVAVHTTSVYATFNFTSTGEITIDFENDEFSPNLIPILQSTKRLKEIALSLLSNSTLSEDVTYDPKKLKMSDFTSSFIEKTSHFLYQQTWPSSIQTHEMIKYIQSQHSHWNEHVLIIPPVLFNRGDTVFFKAGKSIKSGIVMGFHNLEYILKTDTNPEKKVSIRSIEYIWKHQSTLQFVPRYSVQIENVITQWILWCKLQQIPDSDIHDIIQTFVGVIDTQNVIQKVSTSYNAAFRTKDISLLRMLYSPINNGMFLQISENNTILQCKDILDEKERDKFVFLINQFIHGYISSESSDSTLLTTKTYTQPPKIQKLGIQFDLSDDDSDSESESSSDSDDDEDKSTTNVKKVEIIPIQIDSLIERIQKIDSYFTGKKHFKEGYARSCQKNSGSQPLALPPQEFEYIRNAYFTAYQKNIDTKHDSITICSPNQDTDLQKNTCAAIEFRDNVYICPNEKSLLASVSQILPPKLIAELESQQDHKRTFIGINSANAPCCFKKPNKNVHNYINTTPLVRKQMLYSPYIKDWGHSLPSMRFGFCPPSMYAKLHMNICEHGNITADSAHDCLLRLGVPQGPDVLLQCCRLIYSINIHSPPVSLHDFKKEICTEILQLNAKKERELLSPFSMGFSSEKQNFVEYILSRQDKAYSQCLSILHKLLTNVRIVIMGFEADQLHIKCMSNGSHITKKERACFFLETIHDNRVNLEILVHVDSKVLKLNQFSTIKYIFSPDNMVQGQNIYQVFMKKYKTCQSIQPKTLPAKEIRHAPFPNVPQYHNLLQLDSDPIQVQDAYGKVIAVQVKDGTRSYVLPTLPTRIDPTYELTEFTTDKLVLSNAVHTYRYIQKVIEILQFIQLQPTRTIGSRTHVKCFEFQNGQVVPVLPTLLTDFQNETTHIPHSQEAIYSDINQIILATKIKYDQHVLKFEPLTTLVTVLGFVSEHAQYQFTADTLYRIPKSKNVGILSLTSLNLYTKTKTHCGIHVDISDIDEDILKQYKISIIDEEPDFNELSCIETLMHFWRHSNYTVYCRPYRYRMNDAGMYTHLIIENGYEIKCTDSIHCLNEIDGTFRNERLRIVELYHESDTWLDVTAHKDAYRELHTEDINLADEINALKKKWTIQKQRKIFEIVNSSKIPQSQYFLLHNEGYSDELCHRLIQNPLYIKDWNGENKCPNNSITITGIEAAKMVFNSFYQHERRSYFTSMLEFHEVIPIISISKYTYQIQDEKIRINVKKSKSEPVFLHTKKYTYKQMV